MIIISRAWPQRQKLSQARMKLHRKRDFTPCSSACTQLHFALLFSPTVGQWIRDTVCDFSNVSFTQCRPFCTAKLINVRRLRWEPDVGWDRKTTRLRRSALVARVSCDRHARASLQTSTQFDRQNISQQESRSEANGSSFHTLSFTTEKKARVSDKNFSAGSHKSRRNSSRDAHALHSARASPAPAETVPPPTRLRKYTS